MDNIFSNNILFIAILGAMLILMLNYLPGRRRKTQGEAPQSADVRALQLQAYERLVLLMERMNPTELVLRYNNHAGTVADLQLFLLNAVREETAHNYAQQLYVSNAAWTQVMAARNTIMNLINQSAGALQPNDPAVALSKKIIDNAALFDPPPTLNAIKAIKAEARRHIRA
ncbi:MAG: hypothetical protein LBT61_03025 [Prevotellaceae bacterium]|jgi:hypothetical protein|nr:hypothetical protein [Prevotellaceae bacterium]